MSGILRRQAAARCRLGRAHVVYSVAISPDSRFLATAGTKDRTVRLWRIADGEQLTSFTGHGADVYCVTFARDGRSVFSGSADCTVLRWDISRWADK